MILHLPQRQGSRGGIGAHVRRTRLESSRILLQHSDMTGRWGRLVLVLMVFSLGMRCHAPTKEEPSTNQGCLNGDPINVSCDTLYSASPDMVSDSGGNLYLVWGSTTSAYDYHNLRCVFRARTHGEWTDVDTVSTGPTWGCFVAVDRWGRVHVVYEGPHYAYRSPQGQWFDTTFTADSGWAAWFQWVHVVGDTV